MNIIKVMNKKLFTASMAAIFLFLSFAITHAEAAVNDSSINLKKDIGSGLFTLTVKDPDGLQEFSLTPAGKLPYGGGLGGCKSSFSSNNVTFADPSDFTPVMSAYVIDCNNNTTKLEIHAPADGLARSVALELEKEVSVLPPPSPSPTVEKKVGPLSAEDIQYPVSDLGGCKNETECRSYCDNANRATECFAFAKKYNLISDEEAKETADKFLNVRNGPGGCNSGASCEEYCSSIDRLDECIAFAEETGYYSGDELAEARKFQELVKSGAQFPGRCTERNSCEIYCSDASHMEECLNFAETSGFMPQEEIDEARKFMKLMQEGESPGGCNSKEQCENYCSEDGNIEECIAFAEKAGVMTKEEAEMARKVGGKGPGGCHSKSQCEAYCEANSEECFNFAKEHGLISESDLEQMREGMKLFRDGLDKMPPEAVQCMKEAAGEENFNRMVNGEPVFDRSLEGKMKSCFSQVTNSLGQHLDDIPPEAAQCIINAIGEDGLQKLKDGELDKNLDFDSLDICFKNLQASFGGGSNFGAGGFSGPGGCTNTEECTAFCQANPEECQGFGPPGGGGPAGGGFSGPGGCSSVDECTAYCEENFEDEECQAFIGGPGGSPGGPGGGGGSGFSGPGGCTNPEECQSYCQTNYSDPTCSAFGGGGGGGGPIDEPPFPNSSCLKPPSGLVSWWSADLVSGTNVPDITKSNSGTIVGGVTSIPMEVGDAFQFDGRSGYINMGNPESLNFGTGPFSLEAWFNWTGEGRGKVVNNIIRKSNYGSGAGSGYWLRIGQDLEFSVGATTQSEGQSITTAPISAGEWHHVVATKDGSGNIQLYVDGQSQGTILRQAKNTESTSGSPFALGAWIDQNSEFFHGSIDDVSVYNRALSATEARALFEAGSIGKCAEGYGRTNRFLPQDNGQQSQQQQGVMCPEYVSVTQCPTGEERFLSYDSPGCQLYSCRPLRQQIQQDITPYLPQAFDVTPEICAPFKGVPQCSYVGSPDSQNYKLCIQCLPLNTPPTSSHGLNNFFANILSAFNPALR